MRGRRVFAEDFQGFYAADAGQVDVHQDHVRLVGARKLDAHVSVPRAQEAHGGAARHELLDQLQVRRVVLYIEQGTQRRAVSSLCLGHDLGLGRSSFEPWRDGRSQLAPKYASHPDAALHSDDAPHQLDQPLAHDQADARALHGAARLSETVERLEKLRQLLRRQSRAAVRHADANPIRAGGHAVHDDRSPGPVVLHCIGKKVDEDLLQPGAIGEDEARDVELREGHPDTALLRLRSDHGLAFEDDFGQRRRLLRQRQLPRLDLRQIEDFVDQLEEVPSRAKNLGNARLLRGRRRRGVGLHQLGEPEDRIERRAKLMAHAGKEIGLGEVGLLRRALGHGQCFLDLPALGQVAGQLGEPARIARRISNGGEDDVRPEGRAVLAYAPTLDLESSLVRRRVQVALRRTVLDILGRIEAGEVLADDLFRAVALDPLRSGIPAHHPAL